MRRRIIMLGMIGVVTALGMSQTNCNIEFPKPPFDTTGTYSGTAARRRRVSPRRLTTSGASRPTRGSKIGAS